MLNNIMTSYKVMTDSGLDFYLSLNDSGVTYIIVHDLISNTLSMKFFTDIDVAVDFIRSF